MGNWSLPDKNKGDYIFYSMVVYQIRKYMSGF
jgi:hypothetical protein